jgi:hypothetical protein
MCLHSFHPTNILLVYAVWCCPGVLPYRKHLTQLVQEQLKQPAAQPASQQKSRVAFVRSHPLPIDASCCSEADAADAIRTAAAAADAAVEDDAAASSEDAASSSAGKHLQEQQQFEIEQLQQVSMAL